MELATILGGGGGFSFSEGVSFLGCFLNILETIFKFGVIPYSLIAFRRVKLVVRVFPAVICRKELTWLLTVRS